MAGQNVQIQIDALIQLEAYLNRFSNELQNITMRGYVEKVHALQNDGLPLHIFEKIMTEFYRSSQNHATNISQITEQAISYVRNQIQIFEQSMGR